ncbi:uncharacterized protein C5orf34 homolog [Centroberyx gerrardi]|uniref:uncharacterized protein C5orf34 homolog n=1 Tax=Centroberyx gerrardi TaxID=166262 RepID=UPI003AACD60B
MMAANASVSLMIMYEDESVDVRYGDGSQLQLSPCGCEFLLLKAPDPSGHPLQTTHTVRQRSRFTISTYKEMMEAALVFRNKYATRPYLPEELIPAVLKKPFISIDSDVEWPESSPCDAELGPGGETIVRSAEGRAALTLSSSGEDFSVEFTCSLSQAVNQQHRTHGLSREPDGWPVSQQHQRGKDETKEVQGRGTRKNEPLRSRSCSPLPKPEDLYQSTTVVQHHSCSGVAPMWRYPLSLARHHCTARLSKPPGDIAAEGRRVSSQADGRINMTAGRREERSSRLPEALPLTCSSPHQHRWKFKDPLTQGEEQSDQNLPEELVKVMWCQGVIYRILGGAISVIEVSPGDGSVIRSNGVLNSYFTHHKTELQSGQVKEVTYHLNSLPPDVPGQLYSVGSIVSRASRILTCYNQAKHSLKLPATPSCLQQDRHFSEPVVFEENLPNLAPIDHIIVTQTVHSGSDLVAAELEKIKRFNFLLENSNVPRSAKVSSELGCSSAEEETHSEPVTESCIADALQRTSKAIQDIDALISATTLT